MAMAILAVVVVRKWESLVNMVGVWGGITSGGVRGEVSGADGMGVMVATVLPGAGVVDIWVGFDLGVGVGLIGSTGGGGLMHDAGLMTHGSSGGGYLHGKEPP